MQLFADIRVDGLDIRDRWPWRSFNNMPFSSVENNQFERFLTGKDQWPLPILLLRNAELLQEKGQYSLAVVEAAAAVELRLTEYISGKLEAASYSRKKISGYKGKTLRGKLRIRKGDSASLETYFGSGSGFHTLYEQLKSPLNSLRDQIMHHGYLASRDDGLHCVKIARDFLNLVQ